MGLAFLMLVPGGRDGAERDGRARQPVVADRRRTSSPSSASCASIPVGLSAVTKLSPPRIVGLMMGVWLLSNAFGNKLAGWAAGFFSTMPLRQLFSDVALILFVTAAIDVRAGEADQAADGRRAAEWLSKNTNASATSRRRRSREGDVVDARSGARARSSACRSTSPATCTTTSASSTTACCCRGRCRRGRRSIRRRSGWRCRPRIIRSPTASSKASSPKATAPASSCCGTRAPGRRSRTMSMRR